MEAAPSVDAFEPAFGAREGTFSPSCESYVSKDWSDDSIFASRISWEEDRSSDDSCSTALCSVREAGEESDSPSLELQSGPDMDSFVRSVCYGEVSAMPLAIEAEPVALDLNKLALRTSVRRREMDPQNPLFHSIRTRTASIVSVCFIGAQEQVAQIGKRVPRVVFSKPSISTTPEDSATSQNEILVCVTMRDVTEYATFAFAHGALIAPQPDFFRLPSSELYMARFDLLLTAIGTTIRNLKGQREVHIDVSASLPSTPASPLLDADALVKVDIQPGVSGRTKTSSVTEAPCSQFVSDVSVKADSTSKKRRVYKRPEPKLSTHRKEQIKRPLEMTHTTPTGRVARVDAEASRVVDNFFHPSRVYVPHVVCERDVPVSSGGVHHAMPHLNYAEPSQLPPLVAHYDRVAPSVVVSGVRRCVLGANEGRDEDAPVGRRPDFVPPLALYTNYAPTSYVEQNMWSQQQMPEVQYGHTYAGAYYW